MKLYLKLFLILTFYITKGNSDWIQIGSSIYGEARLNYSGRAVSISNDGNIVAIGAPYNDGGGKDSGHVRVYKREGNTWMQMGGDIDGEFEREYFGGSVSLSADGNTLAVGAEELVRVFRYEGNTWTQIGKDLRGEDDDGRFGRSVSISNDGQIVAVGIHPSTFNHIDTGHARVYRNVGGEWTQIGSDINGDSGIDQFGHSLSLSGDGLTVVIGAPEYSIDGLGLVRVYRNLGDSWVQIGDDIDGKASGNKFGYSVSASDDGNTIAIGGNYNDGNVSDSGHVRVYRYVGSNWVQVGSDINGESSGDNFGRSLSLSADGIIVAIGAAYHHNYKRGEVRVFRNVGDTWTQLGSDLNGNSNGDYFGRSVSLSGDGYTLAAGASGNDFGSRPDYGSTYIFDCLSCKPTNAPTFSSNPSNTTSKCLFSNVSLSGSLCSSASSVISSSNILLPAMIGWLFLCWLW